VRELIFGCNRLSKQFPHSVPKGHAKIAQRFNVEIGVVGIVSPEATADALRYLNKTSAISVVASRLIHSAPLLPTLKRWAIFVHPFGINTRSNPFEMDRLCQHHLKIRKLLVGLVQLSFLFGLLVIRANAQLVPITVPAKPEVLPETTRSGRVKVEPSTGIAGEYGTWTVTYSAAETIKEGGGIRVQLPEAWHAGLRNSANRLQATAPSEPNYISARCSNSNVVLQTTVEFENPAVLVKTVKPSNMSHRMGYYVFIVRVVVLKGEIKEGETLSVIYGDPSRGSKGMRAAIITGHVEPIIVALDFEGRGQFRIHAERPALVAQPGNATELLVHARSDATVGEPSPLKLAFLDRFGNPATTFEGDVALIVTRGKAEAPAKVHIEKGRGWAETNFTPQEPGLLRIQASESTRKLSAQSNPVDVHQTHPQDQIYWGDLHSHTRYSGSDGVGHPEDAYEYAQHISGLDFYAMTDHSGPVEPIYSRLTSKEWPEYCGLAEKHYLPNQFVTLHAYECSFYAPYGHHNVFFRGEPGPLLDPETVTLPELWKALKAGETLTIPHHTLKMPEPIDWTIAHNSDFQRNIEIYSGHGSSEEYDPTEPLAYEQSLFTNPSQTTKTGMSAQKAWIQNHQLSTIASSDDHRGHPGQPQYGIAAVRASALTRDAIFDGLYKKQTYGTTGVRILLDFSVNNIAMGGHATVKKKAPIHARAVGTDIIERIEVLRHTENQPGFQIIRQASPADEIVTLDFEDHPPGASAIYYVRVWQRALVRERLGMAWSSPIWVKLE
jgi:hypothetical protein